MEGYWICPGCGSSVPYPEVTICEVCDTPITQKEIDQAEQRLKDAQKAQDQQAKEEKREARLRKQEEREIERKAKFEAKQKRLEERNAKRGRKAKEYVNAEKQFFANLYKGVNIAKKCIEFALIACMVLVGLCVFSPGAGDEMFANIEKTVEPVAANFIESHFIVNDEGYQIFIPFDNMGHQFGYLEKDLEKTDNIEKLVDIVEGIIHVVQ